ncbi:MAG: GDSL-type esterase/lipase family protein [Bacteroidales bacterium]|jgi:hypothetical protein
MNKPIKVILFLFFVSIYSILYSQEVRIEEYSFVHYNENKIEYFGDSKSLFNPLFEKMKKTIALGSKQIRVLHIGDRQTREDIFTSQIYSNLASTLSGLESKKGMVWDEVSSVKPKTEEDLEIVKDNSKKGIDCNSFRVYHSPLNDSINIIVEGLKSYSKSTYFADKGYTLFELKEPINNISVKVVNNSSNYFFVYGFYLESEDVDFIYDIIARNNASINQYLLDDILQKQIKTMDFDLVVISLGANEAYTPAYMSEKFKSNMEEFIKNIRKTKPNIPIILTSPFDSYITNKPNPRLEEVSLDLIEVAKTTNCAVWDFYNIMGGKGSSEDWRKKNMMDSRKIGLTPKGSILQGDLYYNAFWQAFESYLNKAK